MDYEFLNNLILAQPYECDNEIYYMTCLYKGLTEIYDKQFEYDKFRPSYIQLSRQYAKYIRDVTTGGDLFIWKEMTKEIKAHPYYTSDMWISEYRRLLEEGKLDRYLNRFRMVRKRRVAEIGLKELID